MTAYQIAGPAFELAASSTPATGDITITEVTGNLGGGKTPLYLKVQTQVQRFQFVLTQIPQY